MIYSLGRRTIDAVLWLGGLTILTFSVIFSGFSWLKRPIIGIRQLYNIGVKTLIIIAVSGLFVGMVMALQLFLTLSIFGGESQLGVALALSVVRELGPVLTALLFAGRAGSAIAAEIGLMNTTEQLAAMEMMAVDPIKRVLSPRLWAGIFSVPLLTAIFISVSVLGGHLIGVEYLGVDFGDYWGGMQDSVDVYYDIGSGLLKSFIFGFIITAIAVFEGYKSEPTAEGVAVATTRTVVIGCLGVLGADYILTAIMFG